MQTPGRDPGKPCLVSLAPTGALELNLSISWSVRQSSSCLHAVLELSLNIQRAFKVHTYIRSEPKILCLVTRTMSAVMTSGHAVMFWCTPDLIPNIQRIQQ